MKSYVLDPTPVSSLVEITSVATDDWLVVFRDGELIANKAHPGAVAQFSATAPTALGTASAGSASTVARSDHRHPFSGGDTDVNFACNLLNLAGGYLYRYTTDNVSNISFGDLSSGMYFRNNNGFYCYTLDNNRAPLRCGELSSFAVTPQANDEYDLGSSDLKWDDIYATNGTIQTSDARSKTDVELSDLGLDFIRALRPVRYRTYRGEREYTEIDGEQQRQRTLPEKRGVRLHYGLIAQEVADALGAQDFAGYVHDKQSDTYGLRYSEFIAPIIRAVQELTARVEELERKVTPTPRSPRQ